MGGGPVNPIVIDEDQDDIKPLNAQVQAFAFDIPAAATGTDAANAIKVEDGDTEMDDAASDVHAYPKSEKVQLMRELKALGIDPKKRPDYTAALAEPSWGDSDDEADEDEDDEDSDGREGVLDGEDEDFDEVEEGDDEEL